MSVSEFEMIQYFVRCFPKARVPVGPGDDCAVIHGGTDDVCISTDAIVENVHFTLRHFSFQDIGHKALAVNLSDLAAMGAKPSWFVCAVGWPKTLNAKACQALARGMSRLARAAGIQLVGGNFTASPVLSLTLTVAGTVPKRTALLRKGAKPGDAIYVSGTLGDARLGLVDLERHLSPTAFVKRQKRPVPKLRLGILARPFASACIDISDGFAQDLGHLCEASGVGAQVTLDQLPMSAASKKRLGNRRFFEAARGGEDYELILTVPKEKARGFEKAAARAGEKITCVGKIRRGPLEWWLGNERVSAPTGFYHFYAAESEASIGKKTVI